MLDIPAVAVPFEALTCEPLMKKIISLNIATNYYKYESKVTKKKQLEYICSIQKIDSPCSYVVPFF